MSKSYRAAGGAPPPPGGGGGGGGPVLFAPGGTPGGDSPEPPAEAGGAGDGATGPRGGSWGQRFAQQELAAWRPIMRPWHYAAVLFVGGAAMLATGVSCLRSTRGLTEIRWDYSAFPAFGSVGTTAANKFNLLRSGNGTGWLMQHSVAVPSDMQPPINVYYRVSGVFQNYRRYTKSRSSKQMRGPTKSGEQPLKASELALCAPQLYETGEPNARLPQDGLVLPCGLQAWSFFNDTFQIRKVVSGEGQSVPVDMNFNNIAWSADQQLYGNISAENFNTLPAYRGGKAMQEEVWQSDPDGSGGSNLQPLRGGQALEEDVWESTTLQQNEDFHVWMRLGIKPTVQKLYGVIEEPLRAGQELKIFGFNRFNSYEYGGRKELILSEQNFLGSAKDGSRFLGYAYCTVGILASLAGLALQFAFCIQPRRFGDISYLSWNREGAR